MSSLTKIADWVVRAGLAGKSEAAMLDGFCYRAIEAGLPLARAAVIIDTLHRCVKDARSSGAAHVRITGKSWSGKPRLCVPR